MTENKDSKESHFLSIRSDLFFGEDANKSYGLLGMIITSENELVNLDIAVNYEHTALANEYINIDLKEQEDLFIDLLKERKKNYRSKIIKQELLKNIEENDIVKIMELSEEDNQEEIIKIITENIKFIINEEVEMNIYLETMTEEELREHRSDLFEEVEVDDDENKAQTKNKEKKKAKRLKLVKEKDKVEEATLDEEIKLNCSPVVSPTKGSNISSLNKGDKIKVKITDRSEKGHELSKLLTGRKGSTVGKIEQINYKADVDRYQILIKLRNNIYGSFNASEGLKIETLRESNTAKSESKRNKSNRSIITILIIICLIIFVGIALFYFI